MSLIIRQIKKDLYYILFKGEEYEKEICRKEE